jgi:hypothetical protein
MNPPPMLQGLNSNINLGLIHEVVHRQLMDRPNQILLAGI